MAKPFIILMLLTTQVLFGIGGSVYLCIGDGVYCFGTDPDACSYCPATACSSVAGDSESDAPCCCCGRSHEREPQQVTGTACACEHILISSKHSLASARPMSMIDGELLLGVLAWLPALSLPIPEAVRTGGGMLVPDQPECVHPRLAALSTVVIRC